MGLWTHSCSRSAARPPSSTSSLDCSCSSLVSPPHLTTCRSMRQWLKNPALTSAA